MKKEDQPFPGFAPERRHDEPQSDRPLRVARSPEGLFAVLPGSEDEPEAPVLPVFPCRDTAIGLAKICLALGLEDLGPFEP